MDIHTIWQSVLSNGIYALLILGGGVVLAVLKKRFPHWFTPALWGLIGCALVGTILIALVVITRIPKLSPETTPENVEVNIRSWLDSFQLSSKKMDDPHSLFAFVVTLDSGLHTVISRPKFLDRYILMQSAITIAPEDKAVFDALSEEERGIFAARLSMELAKTGMGLNMDLSQNNITLTRRVPITSSLNESGFMQAFDELDNAKIVALRTVVLMLLDAKKKPSSEKR